MTCYHPLQAFRGGVGDSGKRSVRFTPPRSVKEFQTLEVPCGQCIGCRLERSRQWAVRCTHEAQLYDQNCFLTLTYDDDHLPSNGSLVKSDLQKFLKRLRKKYSDTRIRFFACGEYGEQLSRPHYHVCLFNFDFPDKVPFSQKGENHVFTSESLSTLWPFGFSTLGLLTFESAAYVARYCTKKITGDSSFSHYSTVDTATGEYSWRVPEFSLMSRRPGIGRDWHAQFYSDIKKDYFHLNGVTMRPPRYYDKLSESIDPLRFELNKSNRSRAAQANSIDNTTQRLLVKERCKELQFKKLTRSLHAT